ncbi:MAG TPA: T9SS type A sorting domain-containing protein, partial [Chitinophagaceae bacterium]|nr:T9SS type A sorting domain-containing protein [Chitinophagaceae bacterium]
IGYFRFDLTTMQAEKVSTTESVFNASDLANERLAFAKKKKEKKNETLAEPKEIVSTEEAAKKSPQQNTIANNGISIYPNPVTNGFIKVSFADQPAGKYHVDLIDIAGKLIQSKEVNINSKMQIEEVRIPGSLSGGSYLLKVTGADNKVTFTNKLVVQ